MASDFANGIRFEAFKASTAITPDVNRQIEELELHLKEAQGAYGDRSHWHARLEQIAQQCSAVGWDGGNEPAVQPETANVAREFIGALPAYLPAPEIWADSDGEITFEWRRDRENTTAVSVYPDRRIGFSGLSAGRPFHGYRSFGVSIPGAILERIESNLP